MTWLKKRGQNPEHFFSEHLLIGSHDRSIQAVASGFADGAAVDSIVYEQMIEKNPEIKEQTRIILKSPPFGMPPLVVPPQIDRVFEKQLLSVLLEMHQDVEGAKILASLQIDRFVIPPKNLYDSVRETARTLEAK